MFNINADKTLLKTARLTTSTKLTFNHSFLYLTTQFIAFTLQKEQTTKINQNLTFIVFVKLLIQNYFCKGSIFYHTKMKITKKNI